MGTEILAVPEELLQEVVTVIRTGLCSAQVSDRCANVLHGWSREMEDYLDRNKTDKKASEEANATL